jgi:hypothetical protein
MKKEQFLSSLFLIHGLMALVPIPVASNILSITTEESNTHVWSWGVVLIIAWTTSCALSFATFFSLCTLTASPLSRLFRRILQIMNIMYCMAVLMAGISIFFNDDKSIYPNVLWDFLTDQTSALAIFTGVGIFLSFQEWRIFAARRESNETETLIIAIDQYSKVISTMDKTLLSKKKLGYTQTL